LQADTQHHHPETDGIGTASTLIDSEELFRDAPE
jgi:hypothetical protein